MIARVKCFGFRAGCTVIMGVVLAASLSVSAGAVPAGAASVDDSAAVQDLTALLQKSRINAGQPPLTVQPLLAAVAAGRAVALSGAAPVGDVHDVLVAHHYIPMQVVVLDARAGSDPSQALAVWQGDSATRNAALTPGISEVGVARMPNPATRGPNDAYIWEVVLAQPLNAPPEH